MMETTVEAAEMRDARAMPAATTMPATAATEVSTTEVGATEMAATDVTAAAAMTATAMAASTAADLNHQVVRRRLRRRRIPGLIGDIAVARSIGIADSANTAAAARHALRTKPGVEIEILMSSSSHIAGNSKPSSKAACVMSQCWIPHTGR